MSDYKALIANCPMRGEKYGISGGRRYLNTIKVTVGGFDVEIEEIPDLVVKNFGDFRGRSLHTSDLYIRNISSTQLSQAETLAQEIAELLSLATCSPVVKYGYSFDGYGEAHTCFGQLQYFRPIIDTHQGKSVRTFLETCHPTYHRLRGPRKLYVALQYHTLAQQNDQPMELLLAITFVLLENLKYNYAVNVGYPLIRGYFRQFGATSANPGHTKEFRKLLSAMFGDVGMSPDLSSIISLRNDIIHSGISTMGLNTQTHIYSMSHDIIREYLLRLLNYVGGYYPYSSPNSVAALSARQAGR